MRENPTCKIRGFPGLRLGRGPEGRSPNVSPARTLLPRGAGWRIALYAVFRKENRTRDPLQRGQGGKQGAGLGINPKMSERRRRGTTLRPFPNKPRVTSETVPPAQNSVPAPLSDPEADITLLKDDFGRQRILASPLSGRQVPVVSAYTRAKDSFTAVRCPTRSLSQISQPQTSRRGGIFYAFPPRFAAL